MRRLRRKEGRGGVRETVSYTHLDVYKRQGAFRFLLMMIAITPKMIPKQSRNVPNPSHPVRKPRTERKRDVIERPLHSPSFFF